jgi:hypothetical protein
MKTFTVIHIILFLLVMLVYQCASAQDYLVTTKGDTIRGELRPLTFGTDKKVQVVDSNKKKTSYPLFQIRAYSFKGDTYQPVRSEKGYSFMKLIKSGYLSLYNFQMENQVTFDGQYLLKKDGKGLEVPNLSFKKIMGRFLEDCPQVAARIDAGDLGKKELVEIVDAYNACVDNRTVDHSKIIVMKAEQTKKISAWDDLEEKINAKEDFQGKTDALEMIAEIKNKIKREEKVPNFLVEGLKSSLAQANLSTELDAALSELQR